MPEAQYGADIRRELARRAEKAGAKAATKTSAADTGAAETRQSRPKRPTKKEN